MTDRDVLELMLANDVEPILDVETIDELLARSLVRDSAARWPGEVGYEDTHDLNRAAARGWRMKAARVAGDYDLDVDGKGLKRSEMVASFLTMAKAYASLGRPRAVQLEDRREPAPWPAA
jgi:hypothetical protein